MINGYVITLDTSQESIEASHKCIGSIRSTESEIDPHVLYGNSSSSNQETS